jgi:hypothetical protein
MRISKLMAVGATGCALVTAISLPAAAGTAHHAAKPTAATPARSKQFPSTLSPHSVKPGTHMVLKGHGAKKRTAYSCVFVVIKGANYDIGPITNIKSSKKGKITCKRTFEPYTAHSLSGGANRKCPLSKASKKAHWRCGLAVSTLDKSSNTIQYFTAKK